MKSTSECSDGSSQTNNQQYDLKLKAKRSLHWYSYILGCDCTRTNKSTRLWMHRQQTDEFCQRVQFMKIHADGEPRVRENQSTFYLRIPWKIRMNSIQHLMHVILSWLRKIQIADFTHSKVRIQKNLKILCDQWETTAHIAIRTLSNIYMEQSINVKTYIVRRCEWYEYRFLQVPLALPK